MKNLRFIKKASFCSKSSGIVRKFFKNATYKEINYENNGILETRYKILLDKSSIKTSNKNELIVPNEALAFAIAHEFNYQKENLRLESMPIVFFLFVFCIRIKI